MSIYIVTGGTGFIGRHLLPRLLILEPEAEVFVLVRACSVETLNELAHEWDGGERVRPLTCDFNAPGFGLDRPAPSADHVLNLSADYGLTVGDDQAAANVAATRAVVELARQCDATLHHVSSIAVAGDWCGEFSERDFDLGQGFPTLHHRMAFEVEKIVRESGVRHRVYRPSAIVGDSRTGEIAEVDGLYFFFPLFRIFAQLPSSLPMPMTDLGVTNVVPVDYVADAMVELMRRSDLDGRTFHLANPRMQSSVEIGASLVAAAGGPNRTVIVPVQVLVKLLQSSHLLATAMKRYHIPSSLLRAIVVRAVFTSVETRNALAESGIRVPAFAEYAGNLWRYWEREVDPARNRRTPAGGPLTGRHVLITGASSGIGRAAALAVAAKGAMVLLLARRESELDEVVMEIRAAGGEAFGYPCDITDAEAVDRTVKDILAEHGHVDMLVNNAGRSIRRSLHRSTDRVHDFDRTMAVNYIGAVRLVLALAPQMRERRFGHIVNVSSSAVQVAPPRYAAYAASKAALDKFTEVAAVEMMSDGVTFTTIHMPLVDTPMSAPSKNYEVFPSRSADWAAAVVVRALVERPRRIDTPAGTAGELGSLFTPGIMARTLHDLYRRFPDSAAAKGEAERKGANPPIALSKSGLARPARPEAVRVIVRAARRAATLIPGAYW
ncbi:SDR family oxidoreductase [Nocardia sp. MW-W600-9]